MTKKSLNKETHYYYQDRKQKNRKVEVYTFYLIMGLVAVFIVVILMLVLNFVINILCLISMG